MTVGTSTQAHCEFACVPDNMEGRAQISFWVTVYKTVGLQVQRWFGSCSLLDIFNFFSWCKLPASQVNQFVCGEPASATDDCHLRARADCDVLGSQGRQAESYM